MALYATCPRCGRNNDFGETCVCRQPKLIGVGYVSEEQQNRPSQYELYLMELEKRKKMQCI